MTAAMANRRMFLRTSGVAALSGATLLSAPASAQTEITTEYRRPPAVPPATLIDGFYYIVLDAPDDFGRGYQHGAALRYVVHRGIAQWKQWINEFLGQQDVETEIAEFIHDTDFLTGIRAHTPELYEELQGIAKGAAVDFNTLYAYQMFDEFVVYASNKYRLSGCSGFGVYGRDGLPNVMGQNNDLPPYYDGTHTVLHLKDEDGLEAHVFTFAGLLAQNGVNNRDVGVTMNIVPTAEGTTDGVPMPYIVRRLLRASSGAEAVAFLESLGGSAAPMNFIIGDAEGVVTVENTAAGAKLFKDFRDENWVAHTNHHLEMDTSTLEPGAVSKTVERYEALEEMLSGKSDVVDLTAAKTIFRTKPVLKNFETDPGFPTMESIVIELIPDNPTIHVTAGPPDGNRYVTFDFAKGYVGTET